MLRKKYIILYLNKFIWPFKEAPNKVLRSINKIGEALAKIPQIIWDKIRYIICPWLREFGKVLWQYIKLYGPAVILWLFKLKYVAIIWVIVITIWIAYFFIKIMYKK